MNVMGDSYRIAQHHEKRAFTGPFSWLHVSA